RPRMPSLPCSDAGSVSVEGRNAFTSSWSSSRTSPSALTIGFLWLPIASYLSTVGCTRADETQAGFRLGRYQHMQAWAEIAYSKIACFSVSISEINRDLCRAEIEFCDGVE